MTKIEKQIRQGLPLVGVPPYGQIHAHSTGNPDSTAQNEADYMGRKNINLGFFTHVVGNGRIIQTAHTNRGAYDVGGNWNQWGYASVELIESHKTKAEFERDYKIYVNLLRDLAKEAKLPLTLDQGNLGIITHDYARRHQPNNGTDHVDPYPYLAKWGISRAQFKKDVEKGFATPKPPANTFDISKYHTKKFAQIKLVKADYAYKEVSLKTKVGKIVPKGTILTVVGLEYSGKYPRFKLKSGLYITTRKDTVEEYKKTITAPKPPAPKPKGWVSKSGTFTLNTAILARSLKSSSTLPTTKMPNPWTFNRGEVIRYDAIVQSDGYEWIRQKRSNGYWAIPIGPVKNGKRTETWGTLR